MENTAAFKFREWINRQIQRKSKLFQKSPYAPVQLFYSVVYYKITQNNLRNSLKIISLNRLGKKILYFMQSYRITKPTKMHLYFLTMLKNHGRNFRKFKQMKLVLIATYNYDSTA